MLHRGETPGCSAYLQNRLALPLLLVWRGKFIDRSRGEQ